MVKKEKVYRKQTSQQSEMEKSYEVLAEIYDMIQENQEQDAWMPDLLSALFSYKKKHKKKNLRLLDLGCGTGSFALELAARGEQVVGIDLALPMLRRCDQKWQEGLREMGYDQNSKEASQLVLLQQDICSLDLTVLPSSLQTFDFAYAFFDTLNHISLSSLEALLKGLSQVLQPEAVFLFDLLSLAYIENYLEEMDYAEQWKDKAFFWSTRYSREKQEIEHNFTLFSQIRHGAKEVPLEEEQATCSAEHSKTEKQEVSLTKGQGNEGLSSIQEEKTYYERKEARLLEYYHQPEQVEELLRKYGFVIRPMSQFGPEDRLVYYCIYKPAS